MNEELDYRRVFVDHLPFDGLICRKTGSLAEMSSKAFFNWCVKELEKASGSKPMAEHWGRACNSSLPLMPWDFSWGGKKAV